MRHLPSSPAGTGRVPAVAGRRPRPHRSAPRWYPAAAASADALGGFLPVWGGFGAAGEPHPLAAGAVAAVAWTAVRAAHGRYRRRALGESRGLLATAHDWLLLLGVLAGVRAFTGESSSASVALLALVPALLVTGATGALIHRHLTARRQQAEAVCRVLVVGEAGAVDGVVAQLAARTDHPYVVIGTLPVGDGELAAGAPELGRLPAVEREPTPGDGLGADAAESGVVLDAARAHGADLVLVTPGALVGGDRLRRLAWAVQDAQLALAVSAGLTDVAPGRVRPTTAAGLHLLRIAPPLRRGPQPALKAALDRVGAACGLVLLAPLFAALVVAIRLDSRGPALFRQTRVGHRGAPFTMWKFRTMVRDAEALRPGLAAVNEHAGTPLFKLRRDPRVTRVGRLLRRCSLDELPQLVNVVRGEMSLVGPRPPLPEEAARYGRAELRRLAVKPGLTGPWQVGGRSELSWDEGLALDLSYVDNWSVTGDLDVLARTVRAVVDGRGAY